MNQNVKLPIGIENFEKMRTEGFYYIDKTGFIKELLENWGEVNLFTRPRPIREVPEYEYAPLFLRIWV